MPPELYNTSHLGEIQDIIMKNLYVYKILKPIKSGILSKKQGKTAKFTI